MRSRYCYVGSSTLVVRQPDHGWRGSLTHARDIAEQHATGVQTRLLHVNTMPCITINSEPQPLRLIPYWKRLTLAYWEYDPNYKICTPIQETVVGTQSQTRIKARDMPFTKKTSQAIDFYIKQRFCMVDPP